MPRIPHDGPVPPQWPEEVVYLRKPRLERSFPTSLIPFIATPRFAPHPSPHPAGVVIKRVAEASHPANGQRCLVARKNIKGGEMIIPYLGIIHVTFTPSEDLEHSDATTPPPQPSHEDSDYDLSLLRVSASDPRNPYPGYHVSIGVDAAEMGNAARFVNDYRGIGSAPNAEFRLGKGDGGEMRMEVWSLKSGVSKGQEVLVSYGKGWWGARR